MFIAKIGSPVLLILASTFLDLATAQWQYRPMSSRPSRRVVAAPLHHEYLEVSPTRVKRHAGYSRKRATDQTEVDLQTSESWYWGGADTTAVAPDDANPQVNLTGIADDSTRYLSEERFSNYVRAVDCSDKDVKITFNDQGAFGEVQNSWKWVNNAGRSVVVVLAPNTCNNPKRQPYRADSATFDANGLTATFTASQEAWRDAIKQGKLRVSTQGVTPDLALTKRIGIDQTKSIDVTKDFSQTLFSQAIPGTSLTADIDCAQCGTRGKFNVEIDVDINLFSPNTGFAQITPDSLGADLIFGFKVGGELTSELSAQIGLPPITLAGINVPGVVTIGPLIRVVGQASLSSVSAEAQITMGAKLDIPQDSIAKVDFSNSANNQLSGWAPTITPVGPDLSASVSVSGNVGPVVSLELTIDILSGKIAAGAGLAIAAPQLNLALSANADTAGGVCGSANAQLGVEVDVGLSAELDAFGGFGDPKDLPNKVALLSTSTPLFSSCFTIGGTATAAPTTAETTAASTTAETTTAANPPPAGPTGTLSRFPNGDCTAGSVLAGTFSENDCVAVTNVGGDFATFQSGSLDFGPLDTLNGCSTVFYSDSGCTTQAGIAFQPASGQCLNAAEINAGAEQIQFMKVADCL